MAQKPEIKIDKVIVFDSKLESKVKQTTKTAAEDAASATFDEKYVIRLTPTLKLDEKAREIVATCSWVIYEGGGSRLFARFKQASPAKARATVMPDKITQGNLDDTIGAVVDKEVSAIMKAFKAMK